MGKEEEKPIWRSLCLTEGRGRLRPPDQQRKYHVWEENEVSERDDRELVRKLRRSVGADQRGHG